MLLLRVFLITIFSFYSFITLAQRNKSKSNYNTDVLFHFGPSIFQGDVASGVGFSNKSVSEIRFDNSNLNIGVGINHRISKRFGVKSNVNFLQLCGNDKWGKYKERALRFRTFSADLSLLVEYSLIHWEYANKLNYRHHIFISSGIAFFYYNPMGQYQGKWYSLRPLGTEGQGLKPGTKKYSAACYSLPFNIGYRYRLNRRDMLGLEFCFRKTFTDYVDDVSDTYYDNGIIAERHGAAAAYFADPNVEKMPSGTGRGNPSKGDNYSFFNITYSRLIGVPHLKVYSKKLRWASKRPNRI